MLTDNFFLFLTVTLDNSICFLSAGWTDLKSTCGFIDDGFTHLQVHKIHVQFMIISNLHVGYGGILAI